MLIRLATPEDADGIIDVYLRARERMTYLPEVRTPDEIGHYFGQLVLPNREVWVAEQDDRVLGFVALGKNSVEHLYVHPWAQSFGVGSALLDRAKTRRPEGLEAWVYQRSMGAREFLMNRGFELIELTQGDQNEEQEPDARYAWKPALSG